MSLRHLLTAALLAAIPPAAEARVVSMRAEKREPVLAGKAFGAAGAYEKLSGTVRFALDPAAKANAGVIDLALAPRNSKGEVEFTADFCLLRPADAARANGRLLYEVGNRGGKAALVVFQKAKGSAALSTEAEFGDGALMAQGYTILWMGWQWDVPQGRMRMDMPVATDHGQPITGLVRGNFIPNEKSDQASVADRGHLAYPVADPASPENILTVRDRPVDPPKQIARERWSISREGVVTLLGGFELGRIYDAVYRARDPRVLGCSLAATRDLISYAKYSPKEENPLRAIRWAYGWGVSQSGRFLRHFLYEGFNADEQGRKVFDAVFDEVGGAGRGSFNHRFGQASRDAEQFFNIFFPVDMFPFTDGPETDPETGRTDSLLARAEAAKVSPKVFHLLSNSEYFNRAGSLLHTDPEGRRDIEPPPNVRIYAIDAGPHYYGPFPAEPSPVLAAPLSHLNRAPAVRALLAALDDWVNAGAQPPASRYPRIDAGTLVPPPQAGWPRIPGVQMPPPMLITYRLDFGPRWGQGIVDYEPPRIGKPYRGLVPAVDADGNARGGIRLPAVAVPVGTYTGWNYRPGAIGSPDQLSGEAGAFLAFARTRAGRGSQDSRPSIEERYSSRDAYLEQMNEAADRLLRDRFLLPADLADIRAEAARYFDWATRPDRP